MVYSQENRESFSCSLQQFQGPLEILLDLIEKEKLGITEVSLAAITDQYLEYLRGMENIDTANLVHFLAIASKLILIKSRALLPTLELDRDEGEDSEDLKRRLQRYKRFKNAGLDLGKLAKSNNIFFSRESFLGIKTMFFPPPSITSFDIKTAFERVLGGLPQSKDLPCEVEIREMPLEEKVKYIRKKLEERMEQKFEEVLEKKGSRLDTVVTFLAVLEMVKQGVVMVRQKGLFGEIVLCINE